MSKAGKFSDLTSSCTSMKWRAVRSVHPNSACSHGSQAPCGSRCFTSTRCSPMATMSRRWPASGRNSGKSAKFADFWPPISLNRRLPDRTRKTPSTFVVAGCATPYTKSPRKDPQQVFVENWQVLPQRITALILRRSPSRPDPTHSIQYPDATLVAGGGAALDRQLHRLRVAKAVRLGDDQQQPKHRFAGSFAPSPRDAVFALEYPSRWRKAGEALHTAQLRSHAGSGRPCSADEADEGDEVVSAHWCSRATSYGLA